MEITNYIEQTLLEVFENYTLRGYFRSEEPLSPAQHMAQCGTLAQVAGYDDEVVLATFFHDIGYILEPEEQVGESGEYTLRDCGWLGAAYLRDYGFSERIALLVEGHFEAKRYLALRETQLQEIGDPELRLMPKEADARMTPDEASRFEERIDFLIYLKMREWNEAARRSDQPALSIMRFKDMARTHLLLQFGDLTLA
jgi:predicted HD phosphohydrolase